MPAREFLLNLGRARDVLSLSPAVFALCLRLSSLSKYHRFSLDDPEPEAKRRLFSCTVGLGRLADISSDCVSDADAHTLHVFNPGKAQHFELWPAHPPILTRTPLMRLRYEIKKDPGDVSKKRERWHFYVCLCQALL